MSAGSRPGGITIGLIGVATAMLAGCTATERPAPVPVRSEPIAPPSAPALGPVLSTDGACTGPAPATAATIEPGIGECDLVRLKAKPPTDVLVGEGRSGREVQVLYTEPGARELYFFVNNRLDRIVR